MSAPAPAEPAVSPSPARLARGEWIALAALLALAAGLRLWGLTERGLVFTDEGIYCTDAEHWLERKPSAIRAHPAQGIALGLVGPLLGPDVTGFLRVQAVLGVAGTLLVWGMTRRWEGQAAAWAAGGAWATAPFLLHYQRGCLTDGNALVVSCAGLAGLGTALGFGAGAPAISRRGIAAAGFLLGLAWWFAPGAALAAAFGTLALVVVERRAGRAWPAVGRDLVVCVGAGLLSGLAVAAAGMPVVSWRRVARYVAVVGDHMTASTWSTAWLDYTVCYLGPVVCLLAAAGVVVAARRRQPADVLFGIVGAGQVLFLARTAFVFPRLCLPLALPVLWFAGVGAEWIAARVRLRAGPVAAAGAVVVLLLAHAAGIGADALAAVRLRSGYVEASAWLAPRGAGTLLTSQSSQILNAVGHWSAVAACDDFRALWRSASDRRTVAAFLRQRQRDGCTHLVVDYLFWSGLGQREVRALQDLLDRHAPVAVFANPAGRDRAVLEETGAAAAVDDPRAGRIWVFSLPELCAALEADPGSPIR